MAAEVIWGRHPVYEALRAGRSVKRVLLAEGIERARVIGEIVEAAKAQGIPVQSLDRGALDSISGTDKHQGVLAEVVEFRYATLEDILARAQDRSEPPLILVLDGVQDPQNLGSLLRTAEAVGAHGVVIPKHRAAGISAAVVKTSAGAVQYLLVAQETNLARAIEAMKKRGVWVVGLDMGGKDAFDEVDLNMPLALVVGAEGKGVSRLVKEKCDFLVRIPMRGHVASLNAAVAGSIVLYRAWRGRPPGD
ncbi:MAG: 23S rRNA (guanosine(2251)-2'-O)-methyltransferase RlmB [Chloroflexi bacterium]|nr:23S rRNA (guanosine(2251)-2'-O)-methyltransferase RlmB [Chloroflexota bacterium]